MKHIQEDYPKHYTEYDYSFLLARTYERDASTKKQHRVTTYSPASGFKHEAITISAPAVVVSSVIGNTCSSDVRSFEVYIA